MIDKHGGNITRICSTHGLKPDEIIDFSANINPLGFPSVVKEAICSNIETILHYPDPNCFALKEKLANKYHCNEANIVVGNGSTELFYLIPRAIRTNHSVVFQPTFTEFPRALKCSGTTINEIACNEEDRFLVDLAKLSNNGLTSRESNLRNKTNAYTNIIFLCNPNNPTGHLIKKDDILKLTDKFPDSLIVVDEAFMEFILKPEQFSVISYASELENLIVVRSLTKLFAIPGIRLGFLVAHKKVIDMLLKYKEPWSVNSLAQFAGTIALDDEEFVIKSREYTNKEKIFLYNELSMLKGIHLFEPSVNFILAKITQGEITATILYEKLIKFGIVIRNCSNFVALSEKYFRVAVRTHDENIKLINAIKTVFSN